VAESGALLRRCTRKGTGGSNPPLSVDMDGEQAVGRCGAGVAEALQRREVIERRSFRDRQVPIAQPG
jgi:hypothetical protein